jgi:hypothetical protein
MTSTTRFILLVLFPALVLTGCASGGPPVSDPAIGTSGRKHYGKEHEITLFGLLRGRRNEPTTREPVVGDPEYQEYLEWRRWREFKEYEKWKQENPDQVSTEGS